MLRLVRWKQCGRGQRRHPDAEDRRVRAGCALLVRFGASVDIAPLRSARPSLPEVEDLVSGCRDDATLVDRPVHIATLRLDAAAVAN